MVNVQQLESLAEKLRVVLIHSPEIPARWGGAAVKQKGTWYIALSALLPDPSFTLAHELAHILLNHTGDRRFEEADPAQEAAADRLAAQASGLTTPAERGWLEGGHF
jgi:Zn-dependent peptidase ImmA (M78 family)